MIAKYVNEKKEDWDVYIDCHVFAYNNAKHASSLDLLFEVMFGRKQYCLLKCHMMRKEKTLLNNYENAHTQQDRVSKYM